MDSWEKMENDQNVSVEQLREQARTLKTGAAERSEYAVKYLNRSMDNAKKAGELAAEAEIMEQEADQLLDIASKIEALDLSAGRNNAGGTARGEIEG